MYRLLISAFFIAYSTTSFAQKTSACVKSGAAYAKLIEASEQRTLPGMRDAEPTTATHFVIVWKSKQKPETFYWRGAEGWVDIAAQKAHRSATKKPKYEFGETWYTTEDIAFSKIKNGDTLELTVIYGGKNTTPEVVKDNMTNRLFFKTAKTGWLYIPVNKIIKRPDIVMP